jgi:hypothetical protein
MAAQIEKLLDALRAWAAYEPDVDRPWNLAGRNGPLTNWCGPKET